jgi:hypothetical protein
VQRRVAPQLRTCTHNEDRADDQRTSQQTGDGPTGGECGIRRCNAHLDRITSSSRREAIPPGRPV